MNKHQVSLQQPILARTISNACIQFVCNGKLIQMDKIWIACEHHWLIFITLKCGIHMENTRKGAGCTHSITDKSALFIWHAKDKRAVILPLSKINLTMTMSMAAQDSNPDKESFKKSIITVWSTQPWMSNSTWQGHPIYKCHIFMRQLSMHCFSRKKSIMKFMSQ